MTATGNLAFWVPGPLELLILALVPAIVLIFAGRSKRRTLVLKADASKVYDRMYRWFSLQEHEILQEIKDQKLEAKINGHFGPYVAIGILLLLLGVIPGILWFALCRARATITLQPSEDGTYVSARLRGFGAATEFNQLAGILSMIGSDVK